MSLITETQLKLRDADFQLNLAVEHIGDEDIFRSCINSYITSARSVTLILQKESAPFPVLTIWYEEQMAQLKTLPLMKFFLDQRNYTIHQGIIKPDLRSMRVKNLVIDGEHLGSGTATIWLFSEARRYLPNRSGGVVKLCEEYSQILEKLVGEWLEQLRRVTEKQD